MNKRGEEAQTYLIIEIIIGILVAGLFVSMATNYDAYSNINKLYLEQDLKLLSETLLSSPGEITYNYPIESYFDVSISTNQISVKNNAEIIQNAKTETLIFTKTDNLKVEKK